MGGDRGGRGSGPAPLLFAYKKFLAEIMDKKLSCKFKYTRTVNESAWLETEGPLVRASPASLCCVLGQEH